MASKSYSLNDRRVQCERKKVILGKQTLKTYRRKKHIRSKFMYNAPANRDDLLLFYTNEKKLHSILMGFFSISISNALNSPFSSQVIITVATFFP